MEYMGFSESAIDDKGRIFVPGHIRTLISVQDHDTWYLVPGFDDAIFAFPAPVWHKLAETWREAPTMDPEMNDFFRFTYGLGSKTKLDGQGRLAVPGLLREYAGLKDDAVLSAVRDHLQIWSKANWQAFRERQSANYKATAKRMFGGWLDKQLARRTGDEHGLENRTA